MRFEKIWMGSVLVAFVLAAQLAYAEPEARRSANSIYSAYGMIKNQGSSYAGVGLGFGRVLTNEMLVSGDSLAAEAGVFLYQYIAGEREDYTALPIRALLRYGLGLSDSVQISAFGGLLKTLAFYSPGFGTEAGKESLSSTQLSLGVGLEWNVIGGWALRADVGTDLIGGGVAFHF